MLATPFTDSVAVRSPLGSQGLGFDAYARYDQEGEDLLQLTEQLNSDDVPRAEAAESGWGIYGAGVSAAPALDLHSSRDLVEGNLTQQQQQQQLARPDETGANTSSSSPGAGAQGLTEPQLVSSTPSTPSSNAPPGALQQPECGADAAASRHSTGHDHLPETRSGPLGDSPPDNPHVRGDMDELACHATTQDLVTAISAPDGLPVHPSGLQYLLLEEARGTQAAAAATPAPGLHTEQRQGVQQPEQQQQQQQQPLEPAATTPQTVSPLHQVYGDAGPPTVGRPLNLSPPQLPPPPLQPSLAYTVGVATLTTTHDTSKGSNGTSTVTSMGERGGLLRNVHQWAPTSKEQLQQQHQRPTTPPDGLGAWPPRGLMQPHTPFQTATSQVPQQLQQSPAADLHLQAQGAATPHASQSNGTPHLGASPLAQTNGYPQRYDGPYGHRSYGSYGPYDPPLYGPDGQYRPGAVASSPVAGYPLVPPSAANAMPGVVHHWNTPTYGNVSASPPGGALATAAAAAAATAAAVGAVAPMALPSAYQCLAQAMWAAYGNPNKPLLIANVLQLVICALGSGGLGYGGALGGPTYEHWRTLQQTWGSGGGAGSSDGGGSGRPAGPPVRVFPALPKALLAQMFTLATTVSAPAGVSDGGSGHGVAGAPAQQRPVQAGRQPQGDRVVWVGPKEPDNSEEPRHLTMTGGWKQVKLMQLQQGMGSGLQQGMGQGSGLGQGQGSGLQEGRQGSGQGLGQGQWQGQGLEAWPQLARALVDGRLYLASYITFRRCLQGHDASLHKCHIAGPPHVMHTIYCSWLVERKEFAPQAKYEEQKRARRQTGNSRILELPRAHKGEAPEYALMEWQPEWPAWWVAKPPDGAPTPRRTGARATAAQQQQQQQQQQQRVYSAVSPPTAPEAAQAATAADVAAAAAAAAAAAGSAAPPEAQLQALTLASCPPAPKSPTAPPSAPVANVGHIGGCLTLAAANAAAVAAADGDVAAAGSGRASLEREQLHAQAQQKRRTAPPAEPAGDAYSEGYGVGAVLAAVAPPVPAGSSGARQAAAAAEAAAAASLSAAAATHDVAGRHAGPPAGALAAEEEGGPTAGDAEDDEGPPDARRRRTSAEQPAVAGADAGQEFKLSEEDAARVMAVEEGVRFFLTRPPAAQSKYMNVMLQEEFPCFQDVQTLCFGNKSGHGLLNIITHVVLRRAGVPDDKGSAAAAPSPPQPPDAAAADVAASISASASTAAAVAASADTGASAGPPAAAEAAAVVAEAAVGAVEVVVEAAVGAAAVIKDLPWDCPALDEEQQEGLEVLLEVVLQHYGPEQGKQLLLQRGPQWQDTALHTCCRYGLLRVLRSLLPRCDKDVLLAATKSRWHPLHTACRARQTACAVAVLRRAAQLWLVGREGSSAIAELLLSAPEFNEFYRDYRGREVLERAISHVRPVASGQAPAPSDACPSHVSMPGPISELTTTVATAPPAPAAAAPWCVAVLSDEEQLKGLWMRACPPCEAGPGQEHGKVQGQQEAQ